MPSVSVLEQFSIIAVIVVVIGLLARYGWYAVREVRNWMIESQAAQNDWQEEQAARRDQAQETRDVEWRSYLERVQRAFLEQLNSMQRVSAEQVESMQSALKVIAEQQSVIIRALTEHDDRAERIEKIVRKYTKGADAD